ncbi:uncharacterized protein LOC122282289 [Carya illinoinensis]|uniref:uncharacterized protein LOC122282289 n=1 Tax=Carya illinoinensis TaxID=32201 RepID=UPI001C724FA5|nr:uncharacterized protein LOC122282289 [Carya illinoinensis]
MEETLIETWGKLKLIEREQADVLFDLTTEEATLRRGNMSLLGLVITEKVINSEAFKISMGRIWKLRGGLKIKGVGKNLFLFEFDEATDMQKVKLGRPWTFDRQLLCLKDYNGQISPKEMVFDKEPLWVQVHNIPLGGMTRKVGEQTGRQVGEVLDVDVDEQDVGWGPYLHIKILIDITKPLMRGVMGSFNGTRVWLQFQYERLPSFCFNCGIIKHSLEGCQNQESAR